MSNLKIDIIYYKTQSDFEMEFNLSGCCRMRMFKDKVETPKGLINTLARDVSRSKITIIVSDLFGESNGISILSKAVKLPLVSLDKAEYGVQTTDEIYIPKTAIPLVTKSGIFGGCIIENGPQSIIVVSNIRALRHEIMKTYVHNYVFDVGQMMAYQERIGSTDNATIHPRSTNLANAPVAEPKYDNSNDIETNTNEAPIKVENNFTIIEPEKATDEELGIETSALTDIKPTNKKNHRKVFNVALLIIVVLLLIGFGILAYYFVYMPLLNKPNVFGDANGNVITEFLYNLFS